MTTAAKLAVKPALKPLNQGLTSDVSSEVYAALSQWLQDVQQHACSGIVLCFAPRALTASACSKLVRISKTTWLALHTSKSDLVRTASSHVNKNVTSSFIIVGHPNTTDVNISLCASRRLLPCCQIVASVWQIQQTEPDMTPACYILAVQLLQAVVRR